MGELDRGMDNSKWIWIIVIVVLLSSSSCGGLGGIFDQFKCGSGIGSGSNNSWIWILALIFLFSGNGFLK